MASLWNRVRETESQLSATCIAAAAGMICYLMYYNLEPMKGFYMGMVPLILFAAYGAGIAIYQMAT